MKRSISLRRTFWLVAALFIAGFLGTRDAHAMAPGYVSDTELAAYPIIVVAKWDKAPARSHNQYVGEKGRQAVTKFEAYTRLNILEVVKGSLEPGEHDLMIEWGITWEKDGSFVNSGTSTQMPGDVDDVTKPNLWFLQRTRSWDEKRKEKCLTVGNYREVQPLELKDFYIALGRPNARTEAPKLLAVDKPLVARRVLRYLCGGVWPWPYANDQSFYNKPRERGELLHDEAHRVWDFVQANPKDHRPLAACVYAELSRKDGIARMRALLGDSDPKVRGIAVGVLARHRDDASLDRFAKALEGLKDGTIACQVIQEMAAWNEDRTVPALISFLQSDEFAYQIGDDIGIPALKAQKALLATTGHEFPFDVEASQRAWREASSLDDKSARKRMLEELAPGGQTPLVATAVGVPTKKLSDDLKKQFESLDEDEVVVTIRLRNRSSRPVTIHKEPTNVEMSWPGGTSRRGSVLVNGDEKREFITIQPAENVSLETILTEDFLIATPAQRRLTLSYLATGSRQGIKAWIGTIDVEFRAEWEHQREVKHVEEFWANGNLKAAGKTVNGVKLGEWNYYNEQGDRIRIEYPGTFRGTAICNPEHPTNKGAGKRPAK